MATHRLEITLDEETWGLLEKVRGHEPRASFVKRTLKRRLKDDPRAFFTEENLERVLLPEAPLPTVTGEDGKTYLARPAKPKPGAPTTMTQAAKLATLPPDVKAASAVRYRCRSCDFEAPSPKARCPNHAGALVPKGGK